MRVVTPAPRPPRPRPASRPTRRRGLTLAIGVALLVALFAPPSAAAWTSGTFSSSSEAELVLLQNQARVAAGLSELTVDATLVAEARARSKDMGDRGYFSHAIPPDGHTAFDNLEARGYCYWYAGENIGWNTYPDASATQAMLTTFMASSGHRSNILGTVWTSVGVGAYQAADGKKLWTVLFAQPCTPAPLPTPTPTPTPAAAWPSGTFVAVTPNRVLDSRTGNGFSGALQTGVPRTFQVTGRNAADATRNIPSTAVAVTGNLTVTGQTEAGWLTVTPSPDANPPTSSLSFGTGDSRANGLTVPVGPNGTLSVVYNGGHSWATTQVVFDVTGYFVAGSGGATYVPLTPNRLLDTRTGNGLTGSFEVGRPRTFQVAGRAPGQAALNVPVGAVAVTGNLTVTLQSGGGWLTVTPRPEANPVTSTLNFPVGDSRANGLAIPLAPDGTLSVTYNGAPAGARAHVIFDVTGYFVAGNGGARYVPVTPNRVLDSRFANGVSGRFATDAARSFAVTERVASDPSRNVPRAAIAVTGNLTATGQTRAGWLTVSPTADNHPATSTLNFPRSGATANGTAVALGGGSLAVVYNGATATDTTDAIFDVTGYFIP